MTKQKPRQLHSYRKRRAELPGGFWLPVQFQQLQRGALVFQDLLGHTFHPKMPLLSADQQAVLDAEIAAKKAANGGEESDEESNAASASGKPGQKKSTKAKKKGALRSGLVRAAANEDGVSSQSSGDGLRRRLDNSRSRVGAERRPDEQLGHRHG